MRHQPPFVSRPWVVTEGGRSRYRGRTLNCKNAKRKPSQ
ncbi:MAG: DUF3565 domain-containing protein [Nitrospiraceae bacterium]